MTALVIVAMFVAVAGYGCWQACRHAPPGGWDYSDHHARERNRRLTHCCRRPGPWPTLKLALRAGASGPSTELEN